jgi:hypothetical protein
MGGGVDAPGHAADHHGAGLRETGRHVGRDAPAVGRGVAGADQGDSSGLRELARPSDGDDRRRILEAPQALRIIRIGRAISRPQLGERCDLALASASGRAGAARPAAALASRAGARSALGRAEKATRSRIVTGPMPLAARQAQPVADALVPGSPWRTSATATAINRGQRMSSCNS